MKDVELGTGQQAHSYSVGGSSFLVTQTKDPEPVTDTPHDGDTRTSAFWGFGDPQAYSARDLTFLSAVTLAGTAVGYGGYRYLTGPYSEESKTPQLAIQTNPIRTSAVEETQLYAIAIAAIAGLAIYLIYVR